jgi:hypothetical protein
MSPLLFPAASRGRRPTRFQIRTGFSGPSSRTSASGVRTMVPLRPSSFQASDTPLPMTRCRGMPYICWLIGRMKSRPPPETM